MVTTTPDREPNRRHPRPAAMSSLRLALVTAVAVVLSGVVVACAGPAAPTPAGPLVTVELRGGMCVGGPCDTMVILDRDGRVHSATKPPNDLGVVPPAQVQTLQTQIAAADFAAIKGKPFTGQCPTAFDGQEIVIEFASASGVQHIAGCQVEIDWGQPLFVALSTALGPFIPLPTT